MRVFEIHEFGIDQLQVVDRPKPVPGPFEIVVRLHAVSLNYRDLMVVEGQYNPRLRRPVVPLSDGAGIVESIGDSVTRVKPGDRVGGAFMQGWLDGPIDKQKANTAMGGAIDGVLSEYRLFPESGVVHVPDYLSDTEAAALPCAAVTAWHALFELEPVRPGRTVLIQGTGGVSIFALQFAKAAGFETIVLSSSDDKLARAKELGATHGINYRNEPDWEKAVLRVVPGGVDCVVEVGGSGTLARSLKSVRMGGVVAVIGVLTGASPSVDPASVLMNSIRVQGIYVGSRTMFERMNRALSLHQIHPVIDHVYPWTEFKQALKDFKEKTHFGKVCLTF